MHRLLKILPLAALLGAPSLPASAEPRIYGWVENGLLLPENLPVKAKLDTGAQTSSLDAKDLRRFERDGEPWVRFTVEVKEQGKNRRVTFERKVVRDVKVRGAGGAERRPVVLMSICIGERRYDEQFSLNNRSKMIYPVLIGRRTLEQMGVVDVSRTYTVQPSCAGDALR
ncbi:ATP-dependent zinc protease [Azotobacter bryophylli]|uniref:ATP-dependent zinc protease n=1 Tax=Azotobacter bryophylli TaxID=1986537 RepID=A0ABV7AVE9_9GAMM